MKTFSLVLAALLYLAACQPSVTVKTETDTLKEKSEKDTPFLLGIDNFIQNHLELVKGKRVGLVTNPSGVNGKLQATSDILFLHPDVNLTAYYGPEHGIRGAIHAGWNVADTLDPKTALPIYSLYGKRRKPSAESLQNVDVIIIDIQDIGIRAYTYIYTMAMVMEAAAENGKQVIVLDRPNPIGGELVEGNLVKEPFFSFVGLYPIPYHYGMTIGELALLFNTEYDINCDLKVVPMIGWQRDMFWDATGLSWVPTSPHVPHWETILHMGATGTFGELGVLSEGVGYTSPFEMVGAPWIDGEDFAEKLNTLHIEGVFFRPLYFRPYYLHYQGEICQGVQLHILDARKFRPYSAGLKIMQAHIELYPDHDLFAKKDRVSMFNKVVGNDAIKEALQNGKSVDEIEASWQPELDAFKTIREKYLLYR